MRQTTKQLIFWPIAALVIGGMLFVAIPKDANSHDWYDAYCCQGTAKTGDCQAIPYSSVKIMSDGYQVTLGPGDHRMVTRQHSFMKLYPEVRQSRDQDFHACLFPDENTLRCLYVPPFGS